MNEHPQGLEKVLATDEVLRARLNTSPRELRDFCRRWQIAEFSLFGSVVRDDFRPESDVDVMVRFASGTDYSLWDIVDLHEELEQLFGRQVDIVEHGSITNPFRRRAIERDLRVIDVA